MQCPKCHNQFYGIVVCPDCQEPLLSDAQFYRISRAAVRGAAAGPPALNALNGLIRALTRVVMGLFAAALFLYGMIHVAGELVQFRLDLGGRLTRAEAGRDGSESKVRKIKRKIEEIRLHHQSALNMSVPEK